MKTLPALAIAIAFTSSIWVITKNTEYQNNKRKKPSDLTAGMALTAWNHQRSYPNRSIDMGRMTTAFNSFKQIQQRSSGFSGNWEAIGPQNFGGRTLALAFNPQNVNTIFAGSASGGLWRTFSEGSGPNAWHQVETGFPVLGVAAIAINPTDSNEIYIGTGEVYNDQNTGTGFAVRTTRGTYGIGLLKSTDGGFTWNKSIDWAYDSLRGVQDIIINHVNPSTIFAATTEGTYRSWNSGQTWTLVHNSRMATDLLMMPDDTAIVFIAAGNSFSANAGIFRSNNGGSTFAQITSGLPATYSGKAMLDVCLDQTDIMYASIGEQLTGLGLYKSINGGTSWTQINPTDFQTYQGWYSHDVLVHPQFPDEVLASGIDMWKSYDGGVNLVQMSYWYNWDFNATTVGGSEGPFDYVHADIHRLYRHPINQDVVYLATDGGIFRSFDFGETYEGSNGGYQTQQFYANFSCSATDSLFAIGGMQDNATAVYDGNLGWRRVIGGDGLSTAIHPQNDQIVFGSSQYLSVRKSTDHAVNFQSASVPNANGAANTNFAGPFAMSFSTPNTLYAGRDIVYKTTNAGQNWNGTNNNNPLDGNAALVVEISKTNSNLVYVATSPVFVPQVGLFKTTNGGTAWTNVTAGIPNRYILDVAIDPNVNSTVYAVLGGFGTPHLFRTVNGGATWSAYGSGLPDVPTNTIVVDPLNTAIIYIGNDLGVYVSIDFGLNWLPFNDGLLDATLVMDISISPSNRKLRLATHGKGVYQRDMLPVTITALNANPGSFTFNILPNPAKDVIQLDIPHSGNITSVFINDINGKLVQQIVRENFQTPINIDHLKSGLYFVKIISDGTMHARKFVKL